MSRGSSAVFALATASLAALCASAASATGKCEPANLKALDTWNGVWIAENLATDISGRELPGAPSQLVGMKLIGLDAPWKEAGWAKLEPELARSQDESGIITAWGFPVIMSSPSPFAIVISPSETVITSQYREIRYIFTDGRPHTSDDELWPTPWGDSIGCWKGDTLTIDTIAAKYSPELNYASPPLSDDAHFVETLRLTAKDRLESDITVTDPVTLEAPWKVHMVYLRHPVLKRLFHEGDILDNDREISRNGVMTIAPPKEPKAMAAAPQSDAPLTAAELDRVAGKYALQGAPIEFTFERRYNRLFLRVDPPQPFFLPLHATGALDFKLTLAKASFRFTIDPDGAVTGFTGTGPDGQPLRATRKTS